MRNFLVEPEKLYKFANLYIRFFFYQKPILLFLSFFPLINSFVCCSWPNLFLWVAALVGYRADEPIINLKIHIQHIVKALALNKIYGSHYIEQMKRSWMCNSRIIFICWAFPAYHQSNKPSLRFGSLFDLSRIRNMHAWATFVTLFRFQFRFRFVLGI